MSTVYTAIDLSNSPFPDVVEELDYESILASKIDDLIERDSSFSAMVESDTAYKILEVAAYDEMLLRQEINTKFKSMTLAYATGNNLLNLSAFYGIERKDDESDDDLRTRTQLALEGFSCAGPAGAYLSYGLSVDGVKDISVTSPSPGDVLVTVLSNEGDGTAGDTLVSSVNDVLNSDDVRPLTDNVTVQGAKIVNYTIEATLYLYSGPDADVVISASTESAQNYADTNHLLGRGINLSGIYSALHQDGLTSKVVLNSPSADISLETNETAYCTGITLTNGGIDE